MSDLLESGATTDSSYTPNDTSTFDGLQSEPEPYRLSWGDVTDQLLDLEQLEDDWDGMGATAPTKELVQSCGKFVRLARKQPNLGPPVFVVATPDGHVSFEWQSPSGRLEAEITPEAVEWVISGPAIPTQTMEMPWEIVTLSDK